MTTTSNPLAPPRLIRSITRGKWLTGEELALETGDVVTIIETVYDWRFYILNDGSGLKRITERDGATVDISESV